MTTLPQRLTPAVLSGVFLLALVVTGCGPHATTAGGRSAPSAAPPASPAASPVAVPGPPPPSPSPVVSDIWGRNDPGVASVAQAGLVHALLLSETHQSVTLTVQSAYADANRIVVAYTFHVPDALAGYNGITADMQVKLTDGEGRFFPVFAAGGFGDKQGGRISHSVVFDASQLPPTGGDRMFELTFPAVTGVRTGAARDEVLVRGPWLFRFMLPVEPGRVVDQPQEVTAAGSTVRLERVVITPSLTRVWVRIAPPDGDTSWHWAPIVDLDGPGYVSGGARGSTEAPRGSGLFDNPFLTPPGPSGARWTVDVSELVGFKAPRTPAEKSEQRRLAGPWVFTFVIPMDADAAARPLTRPSAALDRFM